MENITTTTQELRANENTPTEPFFWRGHVKFALVFLVLFIVCAVSYYMYFMYRTPSQQEGAGENQSLEAHKEYYANLASSDKAYYERLLGSEPKLMQQSFVNDVQSGVNTPLTQSTIYFITHRYFDNNGNIYEIYDYISKLPELYFLHKDAKEIYPDIFNDLEARKLPNYFNDMSTYVYTAYIEVLHKYNYANVASLATAANQYAGNAFFRTAAVDELNITQKEKQLLLKNTTRDIEKAKLLLSYADSQVRDIVEGSISSDIQPRDRLVGVNQYAAALRYLEALGSMATSSRSASQLFAFSMPYSRDSVPELYYFTSLLNASTLAVVPGNNSEDVKIALLPIIEFNTKEDTTYKGGVFNKLVLSKTQPLPREDALRRMDIYSKWNAINLAQKVPDFRQWLVSNGWTESDFDSNK